LLEKAQKSFIFKVGKFMEYGGVAKVYKMRKESLLIVIYLNARKNGAA